MVDQKSFFYLLSNKNLFFAWPAFIVINVFFNKVYLELFVKEDFVLKKLLKNITIGYVIKIIISKEREREWNKHINEKSRNYYLNYNKWLGD